MKTSNIINKSQTTIPFEDAVRETIDNWQAGPHFSKSLFDIADSDSWPAPWDLFGQNIFCDNSQVLGAFYTLILSEHAKNYNIAMAIVQDLLSGPQGQIIVAYNPLDLSNQNVVKIITSSDIQTKLGK